MIKSIIILENFNLFSIVEFSKTLFYFFVIKIFLLSDQIFVVTTIFLLPKTIDKLH